MLQHYSVATGDRVAAAEVVESIENIFFYLRTSALEQQQCKSWWRSSINTLDRPPGFPFYHDGQDLIAGSVHHPACLCCMFLVHEEHVSLASTHGTALTRRRAAQTPAPDQNFSKEGPSKTIASRCSLQGSKCLGDDLTRSTYQQSQQHRQGQLGLRMAAGQYPRPLSSSSPGERVDMTETLCNLKLPAPSHVHTNPQMPLCFAAHVVVMCCSRILPLAGQGSSETQRRN